MSAYDRSYTEKRNFIRMMVNSPVNITYANRNYQGICKDLSGAGMLIETEDTFEIGAELEVTIQQKGDNHLPFNALVKVARVQTAQPGIQVIGLNIEEILEEESALQEG